MTDPLITMAEQPSQASCKEFHGCAVPHPTARSLKTATGELASLSNAQIGFPDLDPVSRPKLRYRSRLASGSQPEPPGMYTTWRDTSPQHELQVAAIRAQQSERSGPARAGDCLDAGICGAECVAAAQRDYRFSPGCLCVRAARYGFRESLHDIAIGRKA